MKKKCKKMCHCQGKCVYGKHNKKCSLCNSRKKLLSKNDNSSQDNERKNENV